MKLRRKDFEAWFAKLRGNRQFDYADNDNCLIATWLKSMVPKGEVSFIKVYPRTALVGGRHRMLPAWLLRINNKMVEAVEHCPEHYLFTVKRLRELLQTP